MGADMIVIEDNGEHEIIDATGFVTRIVNGYTLLDVLGEGGQVTAYSAEKDGRKFCVREMEFGKNRPVNRHSNRKENENGPFKLVDLIEREARVLMELEHPKIPKVHDIFEHLEEGTLYFYMVQDLILGDNLKNIVENASNTISQKKDIEDTVPKPPESYTKKTPKKEVPEDVLRKLFIDKSKNTTDQQNT